MRGGSERARFIADAMLGRLARWLRLLGYDTELDTESRDEELVRRAVEEDRYLLTRDRRLVRDFRIRHSILLEREKAAEQLAEVDAVLDLGQDPRPFTRCSRCNAVLVPVSEGEVAGRVSPRVSERNRVFLRCPDCDRIYWRGSHTDRMLEALGHILERRR